MAVNNWHMRGTHALTRSGVFMIELTSGQRRKLKSLAHHLDPVVMVGQKGFTDNLVKAVDKALTDHELIKIKFVDFKDEKRNLAAQIVESVSASLVGIIGNIAIIYRENPDIPVKEKIRL